MSYTRTQWVESETPLSADNMNNIEDGIEELQDQKVDKASGKGLSTNDYTTAEKNKLAGIAAGATNNSIIDLVYPIGAIYMSVSSTNPGTVFGRGTWVAWGSGKVPVGVDTSDTDFDTVEETGGAKTVKLTAAQSGLPAHSHPTGDSTNGSFLVTNSSATLSRQNASSGTVQNMVQSTSALAKISATGNNVTAYASQAHNNLQPYITCYMWKRTA